LKRASFSFWKIYAAAAAACAGWSVGAWFFFVSPALAASQQQAALRQELASHRQEAASLAARVALARKDLASARQALEASPVKLEAPDAINHRVERVTALASGCGLSIDEVRPGAPSESPHFAVVPIHVAGSGAYPACAMFLHHLHQAFPDMAVRSLEAHNPAAGAPAPSLAVTLELIWYAKK
jgi:Tfp pilus assembly protein PilO